MNIIKKIFIKIFFSRKKEIKQLEAPKEIIVKENSFKERIKVEYIQMPKSNSVETLICEGNGLGISGKIDF